jgi:hypothetical protein
MVGNEVSAVRCRVLSSKALHFGEVICLGVLTIVPIKDVLKNLFSSLHNNHFMLTYRVSQEERSKFLEVIVSVILNKKLNGFRVRVISLYSTLYRRATRHILKRAAK